MLKGAALALLLLLLPGSLAGCGSGPREDASNTGEPTNIYTPPVNEDGYIDKIRDQRLYHLAVNGCVVWGGGKTSILMIEQN